MPHHHSAATAAVKLPPKVHVALPADGDRTVHVVRRSAIRGVVKADTETTASGAYVACPEYARGGGCAESGSCCRVHVRLSQGAIATFAPHVAASATVAGDNAPRFPDSLGLLEVHSECRGERASQTPECILAASCLRTRAVERTTPLQHCAHWRLKGVCHYGGECAFVHVLTGTTSPRRRESHETPTGDFASSTLGSVGLAPAPARLHVAPPAPRRSIPTAATDPPAVAVRRVYPFAHRPYDAVSNVVAASLDC